MAKEGDLIYEEITQKLGYYQGMRPGTEANPVIEVVFLDGNRRNYHVAGNPFRVIPDEEKDKVLAAVEKYRQAKLSLDDALSKCPKV